MIYHKIQRAKKSDQFSLIRFFHILLICSSVLTCDTSEYCDIRDSTCSYTVVSVYTASNFTGGVHGNNRLGTLSIPDTVTFGRIAAQTCWEENHKKRSICDNYITYTSFSISLEFFCISMNSFTFIYAFLFFYIDFLFEL